jgi:hypothetical protein
MAICKECIHNGVCKYGEKRSNGLYCTGDKCLQYQSCHDVAPRAEVDRLRELNNSLLEAGQEWQKRYELLAREIFEEIEKILVRPEAPTALFYHCSKHSYNELKKKYTEGANG